MKLIKAATVYKATIPTDTAILAQHLQEQAFTPPGLVQLRAFGFVPVQEDGTELIQSFAGGLAFRVRIDEKIIPASVVDAQVKEACAKVKAETGRKPGKKERKEIKDGVMLHLAAVAMVRTVASITCFYQFDTGYLIVPTTSKKISDICTSLLVQAVGSVKTETIHVSNVKHGLSTRLKKWVDDQEIEDEPFGNFEPCGQAHLEATDKRSIAFKMGSLMNAHGLREALDTGYQVKALGLCHTDDVHFTLTADFRFRGFEFDAKPDTTQQDTSEDFWAAEAALQVAAVGRVVTHLTELLAYEEPEQAEAEDQAA